MNTSNILNQSIEEENQLILYIMNFLFDRLKTNKLEALSSILDEKIIYSLILEIEPTIETMTEKLEIIYDDRSYGIRYANYMNIINLFEKYFDYKTKSDFLKFTPKLNIKKKIVVNELLNEDAKILKHFIHILIVMSSISSNKDTYIDRISETEEKYMDKYLNIIEKYVIVDYPNTSDQNTVERDITKRLTIRKSTIYTPYSFTEKTNPTLAEKLKIEILNLENQRTSHQNTIDQLKVEIDDLQQKNVSQFEKIELMTSKQNEIVKELEIARSREVNREDIFNDLLLINQLKTSIAQKELEIEETKKEYQDLVKNYLDKIAKNKKKNKELDANLQEKVNECSELKAENEKFKAKLKELQMQKDKIAAYESITVQNSILKNQISDMKIEKASLETHIGKLFREIAAEKETARRSEHLKENSENMVKELQSEINAIKDMASKKEKIPLIYQNSINDNANESCKNQKQNLFELENECLQEEIDKQLEDKTSQLVKEIEDLRFKKNFLKEENFKLDEENEKLRVGMDEFEFTIRQLKGENEKINFEKEKIEVSLKKIELEYKLQIFDLEKEKEKEKFELKNSQISLKLEDCLKAKENLKIELEKSTEHFSLNLEQIAKEKKNLISEFSELKTKYEKEKEDFEILTTNSKNSKNSNSINNINNLNNLNDAQSKSNEEIQNLKSEIEKQNEKLKTFSENILNAETENIILIKKLSHNQKQYNAEMVKRKEDFEFLKKVYEEQKNKIIKEHEMITKSMYEVVQEFMGIKNELSKKEALRKLSENGNNIMKSFSINK